MLHVAKNLLENGNLIVFQKSRCRFETKKEAFCYAGLIRIELPNAALPMQLS